MLQEYNICYLRYTTCFRPRQTKNASHAKGVQLVEEGAIRK